MLVGSDAVEHDAATVLPETRPRLHDIERLGAMELYVLTGDQLL